MLTLPFDGYSWNFSQHAIALQPNNLFALLSAASLFEGQIKVGQGINELLISDSILTSNMRNGKPDAWRDYQQILAETGLIYSTKLEKKIRITEAGRLLLSGEIGFSELMTIQSLRYQYPNGLKISFVDNQINSGVLIKPGLLILRILIELLNNGKKPLISVDQCQNFLLPIVRNADWHKAYLHLHNNTPCNPNANRHSRRNIQDWFKFLSITNLFELFAIKGTQYITLTNKVQNNIAFYNSICLMGENIDDFWIPVDKSSSSMMHWFANYGHIPTEYFSLLETDMTEEYVLENYFDTTEDIEIIKKGKSIKLSEIPQDGIKKIIGINDGYKMKINSGYIKRQEKTKLHDEIINQLVSYYRSMGHQVYEDKQSIDLLVRHGDDKISLFEVKTATLRNIFQRSRLAVGQVIEYGYRYNLDHGCEPNKYIAFNIDMESQSWLRQYINDYLNIGLVSVLGENIKFFQSFSH